MTARVFYKPKMSLKQCTTSRETEKGKKSVKKADPLAKEEEEEEEENHPDEAPLKPKKQQKYDWDGHLKYIELSAAVKTGKHATTEVSGMNPVEMSPYQIHTLWMMSMYQLWTQRRLLS